MGEAIVELSLLVFEFITWVIDMASGPARPAEPGPP